MEGINSFQTEEFLKTLPGGLAKLALDDTLTILHSTDIFDDMIKKTAGKGNSIKSQGLLGMVYSVDLISVTQQITEHKHKKEDVLRVYFRILQHNGSFQWVMITGKRTDEVFQSGDKTVPVYSCIALDVTGYMLEFKKMERKLEDQRTVSDLSRELFFEYEIAGDTLYFSQLFHEVFNKDPKIPNLRKKLDKTTIIHPDELPAVIRIFNSMMNGRKQVRFELRMIPKDGEPVWYICYASIIFDENKNPHKVVGKLAIANPLKRGDEAEHKNVVLDTLTKVCTKETAEDLIKESIAKQAPDSLSGLMIVEVRNYKGMNEIMKNINGSNILVIISEYLKTHFRSSDIIGRIGVNEFVVFVKDIHSDKIVYDNADRICKEVEGLYSYEYTKNTPSISIGIAFVKGQQTDYPVLLSNANAALVMAKKISTSSFEVFYGGF